MIGVSAELAGAASCSEHHRTVPLGTYSADTCELLPAPGRGANTFGKSVDDVFVPAVVELVICPT